VAHAASNSFSAYGIEKGDRLYIVHYEAREVFLGARLVVGRLATKSEAAEHFGVGLDEVWDARDHVLAAEEHLQRLDPNRVIPRDVLRELVFLRGDGTQTGLKFDPDGAANQQTLRAVRELTPSSALLLDSLIDPGPVPQPAHVLNVVLSRGPCEGECPVYEFTVSRDGVATWVGQAFVDRVGPHVGIISDADFADVTRLAGAGGFFELEDEYPPPGMDLPEVIVEVRTGARDKVVRAWRGHEPRH
jgi:hypothetical protein